MSKLKNIELGDLNNSLSCCMDHLAQLITIWLIATKF